MLLSWSSGRRLFHAAGQATANAWGPMVTVFVAGMNRSPDAAERRCDRPAIELTGIQYLDRYEGADPWMIENKTSHMYTENPVGTQVIVISLNMIYIYMIYPTLYLQNHFLKNFLIFLTPKRILSINCFTVNFCVNWLSFKSNELRTCKYV